MNYFHICALLNFAIKRGPLKAFLFKIEENHSISPGKKSMNRKTKTLNLENQ